MLERPIFVLFCLFLLFEGCQFAFFVVNFFIKFKLCLWYQAVHITYLNADRQVCVIKTLTYRARTDRHTDTHTHARTDKKVKTEGPKIFSNYIFYFKTAIIGGPISNPYIHVYQNVK